MYATQGTQTSEVPTIGIIEAKAVNKANKRGLDTLKIEYPINAMVP